jgi:hypothetical protein
MKKLIWLAATIFLVVLLSISVLALPPIEGEVFSLIPITNEISFYKNVDDAGNNRGQTVQIIAINNFKLLTEFTFEFTADFNWRMSNSREDHYIELSLVKPVYGILSVNYQRIFATFEDEPINQFGIRLSF